MGCKGWIGSHTCIKDAAEVATQLLNIFGSPVGPLSPGRSWLTVDVHAIGVTPVRPVDPSPGARSSWLCNVV